MKRSDLLLVGLAAISACGDSTNDVPQPIRRGVAQKHVPPSRAQPVAETIDLPKAPRPLDPVLVAKSIELLNQAAAELLGDSRDKSIGLVRQAIRTCPDLGVPHIVLATGLVQDAVMLRAQSGAVSAKATFEEADQHFRQGLELLDQPGQPASVALEAFGPVPATTDDLAGDALVWHGYCLVRLAEVAHAETRFEAEAALLGRARTQLQSALRRKPGPETRDIATDLLRRFR